MAPFSCCERVQHEFDISVEGSLRPLRFHWTVARSTWWNKKKAIHGAIRSTITVIIRRGSNPFSLSVGCWIAIQTAIWQSQSLHVPPQRAQYYLWKVAICTWSSIGLFGSKQPFAASCINGRIGSILLVQKSIWLFQFKSAFLSLWLYDKALPA